MKLEGSTLKALTLADGSSVELLYLNDLSTLAMSNLHRLNDIQLDENIYNTMSNISIKNCPAFDQYAYRLALEAPINYYLFNDFVWIIDVNTNKHFEYNDGKVVGIKVVNDDDEIMLVTDNGIVIRLEVENISILGRSTQGVTLMRTNDGKVVSIEKIVEENDEE